MTAVESSPHYVLPPPFTGSVTQAEFTLSNVPTPEALSDLLRKYDVETKDWGAGNTKPVSKFWKEMQQNEAGLELWRTKPGEHQLMRVTHVLRAKVSSPEAYERNMFLLNTGQQFGDGRTRIRNGLLSEKLTVDEMPLAEHLLEVCTRAVTEEEMQCVVDASVQVTPDHCPEYDAAYVCPLQVVSAEFVDHTVEIERSKSYPGLMTVYHLYTVDILCSGLPVVDFNTLEFDHPDSKGLRPLKYVHQWVWQKWSTIQRYLFDGSVMKERKTKGAFADYHDLARWLSQFDMDVSSWDTGIGSPPVQELFNELEREECQLELWGRHDGVPLLMRVVHVLQCKVTSSDERQERQFLFQSWQQSSEGRFRDVNRTMAKKLSTQQLPFDEARFSAEAKQVVREQLSNLADVHLVLDPNRLPTQGTLDHCDVEVVKVEFTDHRSDLERSTSFKDLYTIYHLYTVEVECTGLPTSDFASVVFHEPSRVYALGWKWVTWQQTLDILHQRSAVLERQDAHVAGKLHTLREACAECLEDLGEDTAMKVKKSTGTSSSSTLRSSWTLLVSGKANENEVKKDQLRMKLQKMLDIMSQESEEDDALVHRLPPTMVANLADRNLAADSLLENCVLPARRQASVMDPIPQTTEVEPILSNKSSVPWGIKFCCI